jgi:hypothetical protein
MAKRSKKVSGTFFLRQYVDLDGTTFAETSIDISSYVNVLEGHVLRVKKGWSEFTSDNAQPINGTDVAASGAAAGASAAGQVTTETRTGLLNLTNTNQMLKNQIYVHIDATANIDFLTEDEGLNPMDFEDGYLVATEGIFFGIKSSDVDTWANNIRFSVILECEIVRLSLSDAQAVLVSQTLG